MSTALPAKGFQHLEDLSLLEGQIQQWVRDKRWSNFWPVQRFTINALLRQGEQEDLILSAPTAGGKTMAACLPLLSELTRADRNGTPQRRGFEILYISPLRALIRQQSQRDNDVVTLAATVSRPVIPWMGDISSSVKDKSWDDPAGGILMITPESLEARFLRRSDDIPSRFAPLRAVVIDELHHYFESPRGPQLISLLTRLEKVIDRKVQRIALSATLGSGDERDWEKIHEFLRPGRHASAVARTTGPDEQHSEPPAVHIRVRLDEDRTDSGAGARQAMAADLRSIFDSNDGTSAEGAKRTGLIFTNSRREAERFANLLNADDNRVELPLGWARKKASGLEEGAVEDDTPDELPPGGKGKKADQQGSTKGSAAGMDVRFQSHDPDTDRRRYWPHHGSLDKAIRSQGERRMRAPEVPCTLVATTTLELGIDIGSVEEVAQIGPGHSVASVRQRMGRSGRPTLVVVAGEVKQLSPPPRLHVFLREPKLSGDEHILDRLRLPTFQALAQVCLLRAGRFEAPNLDHLHLSTFVQQLLSLIHQYRTEGLQRRLAEQILVQKGPFRRLGEPLVVEDQGSISIFDAVIERLRTRIPPLVDIDIEKADAGERELFLTRAGEALVNSHSIYAAFRTPIEYTVHAPTGILGTVGLGASYGTGDRILLSGRPWEITAIHHPRRLIEVRPASHGKAAYFTGDALVPSEEVVSEMKRLYELEEARFRQQVESVAEFDPTARGMLEEGRDTYRQQDLAVRRWVRVGTDLFGFPWVGQHTLRGISAAMRWGQVPASPFRMAVFVQDRKSDEVAGAIRHLLSDESLGFPTMHDLARRCGSGATGKFDHYLTPSLRRRDFASSRLGSVARIREKLEELVAALP